MGASAKATYNLMLKAAEVALLPQASVADPDGTGANMRSAMTKGRAGAEMTDRGGGTLRMRGECN